jgi:hypothetical protein
MLISGAVAWQERSHLREGLAVEERTVYKDHQHKKRKAL